MTKRKEKNLLRICW